MWCGMDGGNKEVSRWEEERKGVGEAMPEKGGERREEGGRREEGRGSGSKYPAVNSKQVMHSHVQSHGNTFTTYCLQYSLLAAKGNKATHTR